jgi:signal transduction histidine kinase
VLIAQLFLLLIGLAASVWALRYALARMNRRQSDSRARLDKLEATIARTNKFSVEAFRELHTSMAVIRTTAEIARRRANGEAEYARAIEEIRTECERTSSLMQDLIFLAQADAGGQALDLKKMDLVECVRSACAQGRTMAEASGLFFEANLPSQPIDIEADFDELQRLILILIDNALKYTAHRGWITVSVTRELHRAVVNVRDTGIGMGLEDLPHIFDRFYRGAQARALNSAGTGLSLPIAQWIATRHGGTIIAKSLARHGSNFRLTLPLE